MTEATPRRNSDKHERNPSPEDIENRTEGQNWELRTRHFVKKIIPQHTKIIEPQIDNLALQTNKFVPIII